MIIFHRNNQKAKTLIEQEEPPAMNYSETIRGENTRYLRRVMNRQRYAGTETNINIKDQQKQEEPSQPKRNVVKNLLNRNIKVLHLARDMERKQEFMKRLDEKIQRRKE